MHLVVIVNEEYQFKIDKRKYLIHNFFIFEDILIYLKESDSFKVQLLLHLLNVYKYEEASVLI